MKVLRWCREFIHSFILLINNLKIQLMLETVPFVSKKKNREDDHVSIIYQMTHKYKSEIVIEL